MSDRIEKEIWKRVEEEKEATSLNSHTSQLDWPAPLSPEAFYGLAGDIIKAIEPHTESDPAALLMNFLTAFGSVIGDRAYKKVEATRHPMRLFIVLVGKTSKGRKGTSWGYIENIFKTIDEEWYNNIASGMSSGEGLIWAVRDEIVVIKKGEEVVEDPGIGDKRLLVVESEFSSTLKVLKREGNTLSPIIRNAWDTGNLRSLTKNSPAKATGAHILIISHSTVEDLHRYLTDTECANGFANRFLWICTKRSKVLPFGGNIIEVDFNSLVNRLRETVEFAKNADKIDWDETTKPIWENIYPELSEGKPGIIGTLTGRSEAYVTRLASIYALLDRSVLIKPEHLNAALAVWDYAEASVKFIFQNNTGDFISDQISAFLKDNPGGMSLTQISNSFSRHVSSTDLSNSLNKLKLLGLADSKDVSTEGRRATIWFVTRKEAAN